MDAIIKFKVHGSPSNNLVSFAFEDVRVRDLGAVLHHLPEALAKSYANTVALQLSKDKATIDELESFILRCCTEYTCQEGNSDGQRNQNEADIPCAHCNHRETSSPHHTTENVDLS